MRAFKNTTLVLPGGRIIVPVGIASAVGDPAKVDRAVLIDDEYHVIRQYEVDEITGEQINPDQIVHGIKHSDGSFSPIDDAELRAARELAKLETLQILEFVPATDFDPMTAKSSYWLQPQRRFPMVTRAMRLLWWGLRQERRVGVVKVCLRDRQSRGLIAAHPSGALALYTLCWAEDLREPDEDVLAPTEEVLTASEKRAARHLVRELSTDGAAFATMRDDLIVAIEALVEAATRTPMATGATDQQIGRAADVLKQIEDTLAELTGRKVKV